MKKALYFGSDVVFLVIAVITGRSSPPPRFYSSRCQRSVRATRPQKVL